MGEANIDGGFDMEFRYREVRQRSDLLKRIGIRINYARSGTTKAEKGRKNFGSGIDNKEEMFINECSSPSFFHGRRLSGNISFQTVSGRFIRY